MIHENERIVPSDQNERITRALENGSTMPVQQSDSGWTGDLHVHAIDARGVAVLLRQALASYCARFAE